MTVAGVRRAGLGLALIVLAVAAYFVYTITVPRGIVPSFWTGDYTCQVGNGCTQGGGR